MRQANLKKLLKHCRHVVLLGALFASQDILETRREKLGGSEKALHSQLELDPLVLS